MTWFRAGGGGIPASLKNGMNAVLNKKFGTSGETYAPNDWPDDVNLLGKLPEKTATGSIAHITDGADDVPTKSLKVTIPPTLSGVSSVTETQTGRNLFNYEAVEALNANVIITRSDGDYTVQNNNSYAVGAFRGISFHLKPSSYSLSLGEALSVPIRIYKNGSWFNNGINTGDTSCTFTVSEEADYDFACNVPANSSLTIKKCQFEYGSTAHDYEPYTAPTQYMSSLGRTIHGGQVDIVNGEGTETWKEVSIADLTWSYDSTNHRFKSNNITNRPTATVRQWHFLCENYEVIEDGRSLSEVPDMAIYGGGGASDKSFYIHDGRYTNPADLVDNMGNTIICYPITTPTDFTFDGQEVPTRLGANNFWSDSGDSQVTYRADIDLALAQLSGTRGLMMASRSVSPMSGEEASLDRENILESEDLSENLDSREEVSENSDNEESEEER